MTVVDVTRDRVGERAIELLLPTTALALRYARPHDAYLSLLDMLAASEPGDAFELGGKLSADLPALPDAGNRLGTAHDVLTNGQSRYRLYESILVELAEGNGTSMPTSSWLTPRPCTKFRSFRSAD